MKLITAIIKPFKLDEVREALTEAGVSFEVVPGVSAAFATVARRGIRKSIAARNMSWPFFPR